MIHELSGFECREVLGSRFIFSFDSDRNCIYSFSTIGQKILWMRRNPKVCLEVEEIRDATHWITVLATGWYEEVHNKPEHAEARRRAEQLFLPRSTWLLPAAGKVAGREHPDVVVYRIDDADPRLTGRTQTPEVSRLVPPERPAETFMPGGESSPARRPTTRDLR